MILLTPITDAEDLRSHLDALNESGHHPVAVGIDVNSHPFLVTLVGPYAEGEEVFFDSPWQTDNCRSDEPRCDECLGHVDGIEDIKFPVTIMEVAR